MVGEYGFVCVYVCVYIQIVCNVGVHPYCGGLLGIELDVWSDCCVCLGYVLGEGDRVLSV